MTYPASNLLWPMWRIDAVFALYVWMLNFLKWLIEMK
ncbi:hypothetical protein AF72_11500 [Xylella taiwanensis]|uniref:Uncharacterized protein n=1 Tax=Xylella taiwanensis TaxID=1444770 RepID=Z9JFY5_9GAMM|nr:hypothetical protein AF72_11500 [Xylella taiwanensis]